MAATPPAFERDARIAGIHADATLDAVHRRRSQLFLVMLIVLVALCVATAIAPFGGGRGPVDPGILRIGMVVLSTTFVVYAVEKERALRRLERALVADQQRLAVLETETDRLHRLVNAGHAMSATLELDRVVDLALAAALRLFDSPGGAVFLDRGDLVVQAVHGDRHRLDLAAGRARAVHATRTATLIPGSGPGTPAGLAAPLINDGEVVGVLVLDANDGTRFDDGDLRVAEAFARHAAAAVANARLYRAEKAVNEHFTGLHDAEREFRWLSAAG